MPSVVAVLELVIIAGLVVIGWLIKSYVPAYLNKKAKNLATKEDFAKLLELEKVTTREIESIKGQISTNTWIEQRRWDLKRELYSQLLESFNEVRRTALGIADSYKDNEAAIQKKDYYDRLKKRQFETFEEAGRLVAISALIVDESIITAVDKFRNEAEGLDAEAEPRKFMVDLAASADRVYRLILKEARRDLLGLKE